MILSWSGCNIFNFTPITVGVVLTKQREIVVREGCATVASKRHSVGGHHTADIGSDIKVLHGEGATADDLWFRRRTARIVLIPIPCVCVVPGLVLIATPMTVVSLRVISGLRRCLDRVRAPGARIAPRRFVAEYRS